MSQRLGTMYHSSGVRDCGENHGGMKGPDVNTLKRSGQDAGLRQQALLWLET